MKTDHEYYCSENLRFDRPDMPLTLWRGARIALSWLGLSIGMVIIGYYTHSAFIQHTATPAVPPNFRLSDAHYIYISSRCRNRKRPLKKKARMICAAKNRHRLTSLFKTGISKRE